MIKAQRFAIPVLSFVLALAAPRLALADGWWEACSEREGGGCDSDNDPSNGTQCSCGTGSSSGASIAAGLGLWGLVAYRLGRKRR